MFAQASPTLVLYEVFIAMNVEKGVNENEYFPITRSLFARINVYAHLRYMHQRIHISYISFFDVKSISNIFLFLYFKYLYSYQVPCQGVQTC